MLTKVKICLLVLRNDKFFSIMFKPFPKRVRQNGKNKYIFNSKFKLHLIKIMHAQLVIFNRLFNDNHKLKIQSLN